MLKFRHEPSNEVDENALSIIRTDYLRNKTFQNMFIILESSKHFHFG